MSQQFVFPEKESLVLLLQKLVTLPLRKDSFFYHVIDDDLSFAGQFATMLGL